MKAKRLYAGIMALTMTFAGAAFLLPFCLHR